MSITPLRTGHGAVPLGDAVARFLDRYRDEPGTAGTYAETLIHLLAPPGRTRPSPNSARRSTRW
ncbi:hypothetical protein E1295_04185 [Nonomuraea mesophila]|uniref:Uncharacterized protein n=1 Tax=Nonomuraea mesophila TaxID=2530382 RepID=A0A4R5FW66_9ACTN|nr:hypothetical protein [Nonomuraea mesophila]TDE58811.1 hypothetical protein E1295_04185 [Nonomuraea mesophila]